MATYRVPIVISADGKQHAPLEVGALIDPRFLPISQLADNLMVNATDGLFVGADDLLSSEPGNILVKGLDGKLYVPPPDVTIDLQELVSGAPGNQLVIVDGKLYVSVAAEDLTRIVSSMPDNIIQVIDNKLYAKMPDIDLNPVSAQDGNYIRRGTDNLAYLNGNDLLSNQSNNALNISAVDGKLYYRGVSVVDLLSSDSGQLLELDNSGKLLLTLEMLDSLKGIPEAPIDGTSYVRFNGAWLRLDGNLKLDNNDKILSQTLQGLLATVALSYDTTKAQLVLSGRSGQELSRVSLPAAQFLKDAKVVVNPAGQPAGTYLELTFETANGDEVVYIDVSDLIDEYTPADASINITDYKIGAVVDAASGLSIGAFGITFGDGFRAMTTADKAKLDAIEAGAQVNVPYTSGNSAINITGQTISGRVDATVGLVVLPSVGISFAEGYSLMSEAQRLKLASVESGAQVNRPGVGTTVSPDGSINVVYGTTAGTAVEGNDPRLTEPTPSAGAATATTDGTPEGTVVLAAGNDKTSWDKAATPAGVAQQMEEAGKVDTVNKIEPDADKNVDVTVALLQAEYDALVAAGQLVKGRTYIITDATVTEEDITVNGIAQGPTRNIVVTTALNQAQYDALALSGGLIPGTTYIILDA